MPVLIFGAGHNHFCNFFLEYFGNSIYVETERVDKHRGLGEIDESLFKKGDVNFFFLNFTQTIEATCEIIKKVRKLSPKTKIVFVSSTAETYCKEIFSAGANACIKG